MQPPRSIQQDQFQGKPTIERRAHSIASSRRESRERKSAFLWSIRSNHRVEDQLTRKATMDPRYHSPRREAHSEPC